MKAFVSVILLSFGACTAASIAIDGHIKGALLVMVLTAVLLRLMGVEHKSRRG